MKEKLVLGVNSPLESLIDKVEKTRTSVQVFRGEKVVAKIIPAELKIIEDNLSQTSYRTEGETLLMSHPD